MRTVAIALVIVVAPAAAFAADERPKAAAFLPNTTDVSPGFKPPWKIPHWMGDTEETFRSRHPVPPEGAKVVSSLMRSMSAEEVEAQKKSAAEIGLRVVEWGRGGSRSLETVMYCEALKVPSAAIAKAADAVEKAFEHVVDGQAVLYQRVDPEGAGAIGGAKVTGVGTLEIEMQVWDEQFVREHAAEVDVDAKELDAMLKDADRISRESLTKMIEIDSARLEERIQEESTVPNADPKRIQKLLDDLATLSAITMKTVSERPNAGDSAWWIGVERTADYSTPHQLYGHGCVRRGVAVFHVEFDLNKSLMPGWEKTISTLLKTLADRAEPYTLKD